MKDLNVIRYIAEMSTQINKIINATSECTDIEKARRLANRAAGYVESLVIRVVIDMFSNTTMKLCSASLSAHPAAAVSSVYYYIC